jgi:hypothetical protein
MYYEDKDRELARENDDIFREKHRLENEWNWQESLERWKALGAYIGEYHYYPMTPFKYVPPPETPTRKFQTYEEERQYALNKVLTYLEKEFIK